jgi:predicted RNase H-like nuclease
MRKGFQLYRQLSKIGYQRFPAENTSHQFLEVYPHAAFTILLGHHPLPKQSLEGRLQRQILLYEKQINVPDPMRFFEEVTRYKVLRGNFPMEFVLLPTELDATMAAYCAWLAKNDPSSITLLGDREEGEILIPAREMKARY